MISFIFIFSCVFASPAKHFNHFILIFFKSNFSLKGCRKIFLNSMLEGFGKLQEIISAYSGRLTGNPICLPNLLYNCGKLSILACAASSFLFQLNG